MDDFSRYQELIEACEAMAEEKKIQFTELPDELKEKWAEHIKSFQELNHD